METHTKVIIYLHGMGKAPLEVEKENIQALKNIAERNGYKFFAPESKTGCYYLNPPKNDFKCWDNINVAQDLKWLMQYAKKSDEVILIGFSNGAYFLSKALQLGLLENVSKVGLISGGSVKVKKLNSINLSTKVYIENATQDKWNKKWVGELAVFLEKELPDELFFYRELERSHFPNSGQVEGFLSWLLSK
ncbi:MAG: hypothetical protein ACPGJV_10850 [Bacteriovoracaceae bacterium]